MCRRSSYNPAAVAATSGNVLFYGDNLDVLRRYVKDETVDLVYLDPPFNSNASYSVLFGHADGTRSAAQIKAFEDTWHWDQAAAQAFHEVVTQGGTVATALVAFQTLLGSSTMLAYLSMMAPRLVELRRVLKPTGSLYLHCDPTASHYLKLLLDSIFGPENFRNEIIWKRTSGRKARKQLGRVHDVVLFYTRSSAATWNAPTTPQTAETVRGHDILRLPDGSVFRLSDLTAPEIRQGDTGLPWRDIDVSAQGRHWAYFRAELDRLDNEGRIHWPSGRKGMPRLKVPLEDLRGLALTDVWADLDPINSAAAERLGYPTQKPESLLERIIEASSNPGDTILDPFCGCGTTIAVSQKLGRRWVGIDVTYLAVSLIKSRLTTMGASDYTVLGEPTTVDDAEQLAVDDPYQFQWWALGLIGARPAEGKKGADKGIDGRLFFFDEAGLQAKQVIVSVKVGKLHATYVRDLVGVVQREQAQIGVLISFHEPTQPMRQEAASAGFYTSPWGQHPKIQLLTVAELLAGKRVDMPAGGAHMTQVALPPIPEQTVHPDQLSFGT